MGAITNKQVVLPKQYTQEIIQALRGRSKALELGRRLPDMRTNELEINVLNSLAKAGWVKNAQSPANAEGYELNRKPVSRIAWEGVTLKAETLACIITISEETLADTEDFGVQVVPTISDQVVDAFYQALDATAFFGVDSPWANFVGIVAGATAAEAVVEWDGTPGLSFYNAVSDAMSKVENSGFIPNAIVGAPSLRSAFRNSITNLGVLTAEQGEVGALPKHYDYTGGFIDSTAYAIVGDFNYLVYAFREDMSMKLLTEATIKDGDREYNLAQQDMIGFRFKMRLGMALPNPVARVSAEDGSQNTLKRGAKSYPFAIITKTASGSN